MILVNDGLSTDWVILAKLIILACNLDFEFPGVDFELSLEN